MDMPTRRLGRDERGQATFELMLIIPTFLLLVLLVVDFGILMFEYVSVAGGVRDGVRVAAVNCGPTLTACPADNAPVIARTTAAAKFLAPGNVAVTWGDDTTTDTKRTKGDSVRVVATHTYEFLFF